MSDGRKFNHDSNAPVIGIVLCLLMVMACLVIIGYGIGTIVNRSDEPQQVTAKAIKRITRPQFCAHLYNVGRSEEWCECMGVARK